MIDPMTFARMIQKFVSKKRSVGYSHPPILKNDTAYFPVNDGEGRVFIVTVREWSIEEQLVDMSDPPLPA